MCTGRTDEQLGRLLFTAIPADKPESTSMAMNLPAVKGIETETFILVLNGSSTTPWSALSDKVRYSIPPRPCAFACA